MRTRLSPSGPFQNVVGQKITALAVPIVVAAGPFVLIATVDVSLLGLEFHTVLNQNVTDAGPLGGTLELRIVRILPIGGVEVLIASNPISAGLDQIGGIGSLPLLAAPAIPNLGPGLYQARFYAQNLDPAPLTFKQFLVGELI